MEKVKAKREDKMKAMHKEPEKMARRKPMLAKVHAKQKMKIAAIAASAFALAEAMVDGVVALGIMWLLVFYASLYSSLKAELESMAEKGREKLRQRLRCAESEKKYALCDALFGRAIAARWLDGCRWMLIAACIVKAFSIWLASSGFSVPQPLL